MPAPELASTATVTVRARPQAPTAALELRGELPHWSVGHAMSPAGDGFELTLPLAPGVYAVKAQAPGGAWWIDPAWRTMHDGEVENGAIVVGGTDEPVLHAPAAPWLERRDDGVVIVRAGLRRTARSRGLTVRSDDGAGMVARRMTATSADASHIYFEARLPGAGRRLHYAFVLDDGLTVAAPGGTWLGVALADLPAPPPAWWRDAVVYTIFVDRFRKGGARGAWPAGIDAAPVLGCAERAGGDLRGVVEALPYLVDLGVTVIHLTPLCVAPSAHRYDAVDPRAVDPALGGEPAFARLCESAHERGLRVICDVAATHVHRDFAPFQDVLAHGPASTYWPWFSVDRWPCSEGPDPGYAHYQKGQWQEPLLRTGEPAVADWLVDTFASWVRRGADGVRVDAAADLPLPLVARVRQAVRAVKSDAIVFGEVVPACLDRFAPAALDAATDFAAREVMVAWLGGEASADDVAAVWTRQRRRGAAGPRGLGFAGTHDQPRIATVTDAARARLALLAVTLGARTPLLYYGDEAGLRADPEAGDAATRAFEDSWPDRQPMTWDESAWDATTHALVRDALALRASRDVLRHGDEELRTDGACVVLRRHRGDEIVDVVLHRGDTSAELALPHDTGARVLLSAGGAHLEGDLVHLPPNSAIVLDRAPPTAPHAVEMRARNAELAAYAFVEGAVDLPSYPRRLNVTVTEACNLRCLHCITDAPARTREGRARTAPPWLLTALADAFAHAEHIAFTHGGESLASPALFDALRAIDRARRARTTTPAHRLDIHLATNGMLLDGERLRALVELGVTSLMVSVDGATPATNDRIRVLGDLHRVLDHVAGAIAFRERTGADLRVGISTVLGRANVRELAALGRTCASLGVDWLKIEETYPVNGFARGDALAPDAQDVAEAMAALRDALGGAPLVVVDHLAAPAACTCGGDAHARAFRAADDFAHRTHFRPCRAAWEAAAIDPDGTVHLVDHAGPALGNLLDASFLDLWNTPTATATRTAALAASPRDQRLACVTHDARRASAQ